MFNLREAGIDTLAGTLAGVAQVALGHPLDTIKVRMQTRSIARHSTTSTPNSAAFDGIFSTLRTTAGNGELYKGAASPLCGAMLQNASAFLFWGLSKKMFQKHQDTPLTGVDLFKAGLVVGCCCLAVEHPIDLLKTQMQVQVGRAGGRYRSVFHCGAVVVKQRGLLGLYQGVSANALRFVPGRAVYLSTFEQTNTYFQQNRNAAATTSTAATTPTSYVHVGIAGGIAGGAAWVSTYPFDVVRNTMMGDHIEPSKRQYRSVWDCGRKIMATEGVVGFWRGLLPCLVRGVPVNGFIFIVYTKVSEELSLKW